MTQVKYAGRTYLIEFGIAADALAVEAGEERRRGRSIETLIVVEHLDFQSVPQSLKISAARFACKSTQFGCGVKANRNDSLREESQGLEVEALIFVAS